MELWLSRGREMKPTTQDQVFRDAGTLTEAFEEVAGATQNARAWVLRT
jgi:hypothetical protein